MKETTTTIDPKQIAQQTVYPILFAISFSHLLNDTIQSLIPAIYPLVKDNYKLNFSQIGLITLTFQMAASLFQPFVGLYTDKKPQPYSLAVGMSFTLIGLITLSMSTGFYFMLLSVALIGTGSSIFHPEASRMAHAASGAAVDWHNRYFSWEVMQEVLSVRYWLPGSLYLTDNSV